MAFATAVEGDPLDQTDVDAIVDAWNRNLLPATRFTISGVSRAILRAAGPEPFRELRRHGVLPFGRGRRDGRRPVAAPGDHPRRRDQLSTPSLAGVVQASTEAALAAADEHDVDTLVFPVLGSGNGRLDPDEALHAMLDVLEADRSDRRCRIVGFVPMPGRPRPDRC